MDLKSYKTLLIIFATLQLLTACNSSSNQSGSLQPVAKSKPTPTVSEEPYSTEMTESASPQVSACYKKVQRGFLAGEMSLPERMDKSIRNNAELMSESFERDTVLNLGEVSLAGHAYVRKLKINENTLVIYARFSKKGSQLVVEENDFYLDKNLHPFRSYQGRRTFNENCEGTDDPSVEWSKSIQMEKMSRTEQNSFLTSLMLFNPAVLDPFDFQFFGQDITAISKSGEVTDFKVKAEKLDEIEVPMKKGGIEVFKGIKFQMMGYPMEIENYRARSTGRRIKLVYANGKINRKFEEISKHSWLTEPLATGAKISGLTMEDVVRQKMQFKISGKGSVPDFFNGDKYFTTSEKFSDGHNWRLSLNYESKEVPASVSWLQKPSSDDLKFLSSTFLVQKEAVVDIAARIKLKLRNKATRMDVAKAIAEEVHSLLRYDLETKSLNDVPGILKNGTGVCYHFSIVFASIARQLGLPTRIVGGHLIRPNFLVSHAWNEVKINDSTWWPIEPQRADGMVFQSGYLPVEDMSSMEKLPGERTIQDLLQEMPVSNLFGITEIRK